MGRPITNRAGRDIQNTDRMVITEKTTNSEFMYEFLDIAGYILKAISNSVSFTSQTTITKAHNLGYKPIVWVEDGSGNKLDCDIQHTSNLSFTLTFAVSQSGNYHYV